MSTDDVLRSDEGDVHVYPTFGREHELSSSCWCHPEIDPVTLDKTRYKARVWVHKEDN